MASTLTNLIYHVVFSTKGRRPSIDDQFASRLHAYIGGIIRANRGAALEVGGVQDHVHVLMKIKAIDSLAGMVQLIKSGSSKWVHEEVKDKRFSWQSGYGAFTVSESQCNRVRAYVQNQREHHARQEFADELKMLVAKNRIEYDPQYLLD